MSASVLERAAPVYETFEGWREDIREVPAQSIELPAAARRYVAAIEQRAGVPISHISVGPERTQTIIASEVALGSHLRERAGGGAMTVRSVLVVGAGARQHALCWKLRARGRRRRAVIAAPGNPLMSDVAQRSPRRDGRRP